jgi:hypothetical protein
MVLSFSKVFLISQVSNSQEDLFHLCLAILAQFSEFSLINFLQFYGLLFQLDPFDHHKLHENAAGRDRYRTSQL